MGSGEKQFSVTRSASRGRASSSNTKPVQRPEAARVDIATPRLAGSAMFPAQAWGQIARNLKLSARELQIVRGTFDDQTESAIAAELHIAPGTVHTHVERLHHKLTVGDRAQLILRVMQEYMTLTGSPENRMPLINANRAASGRPFALNCKGRLRPS